MSLEAALKENTETMRELIEVLTRTNLPEAQAAASTATKKPAAKAKADDAEKAEPKAETAKPAPKAAAKAETAGGAADYAPVKQAILDAIKNGHRKSITDMLAEYGAKTGQDLTPDTYAEVLEKIAVITGGEVEDLA